VNSSTRQKFAILANSSTRQKWPFFGNVPDWPNKAIFEKKVTRIAKFARALSESREFGASGHCLIIIHYLPKKKLNFER
jgi:hypothetical protein